MRLRFARAVRLGVLLAIAAVVAVPVAVAGAAGEIPPLSPPPSAETGQATVEVPNAWFVELESKPTAAGGDAASVKAEKQAFRNAAKAAGLKYTERYAFDTLWNGLSIEVGAADASKLVGTKGVKAVSPIFAVPLPRTEISHPDLATAIAMTGADIAQNELGLDGTGVKVAVVDSGIDLDHPDLGGDGVAGAPHPNSRVAAQWDFVGDGFNADPSSPGYNPTPSPDPVADDCGGPASTSGHGTHVSGIVGANGAVDGVAPGIQFGAYRVFGCDGSTTSDIILAAMERALADGMDVLNMSLGSDFTWPQSPTAAAADRLVDQGVAVVAAIGNAGTSGLYSAGAPGVGTKVTGVASYDNTHVQLLTFTISPDNTVIGYEQAAASPTAPTSGSDDMARTGTQTTTNDACAPLPAGSLTGKVALVRRGTCTFYVKALNAMNAGAEGVVIYNNVPGRIGAISVDPALGGFPGGTPITIPVVNVSGTEGNLIDSRLATGPVTMTWTNQLATFANATGGLISSFSSYGLNAELDLKPDLGAPGGFIRSTNPLEKGGYATRNGTSMSSPHVAGAAALFLEAHPGTPPLALRSILQNSADPKNWFGNPGLGFLDNVHRQGAGMLDIDDAIGATTSITPGKLALGEGTDPVTRALTVRNAESTAKTYDLSHVGALSTGPNTFTPAFTTGFATVGFSAANITVPAGGSASVDVTITPNAALPDKSLYGGYLVFTPQGGGQTYRVPYAGFKGDYQSIVALPATLPTTPTPTANPRLAKLTACTLLRGLDCFAGATFATQSAGAVFTLTDAFNVPNLLVHLDHQARRMEVEVLKANDQKVHPVFSNAMELDFLPRNATSTSFFALPWDGMRLHDRGRGNGDHLKIVNDGQYKLVVKMLKALGDPANPAHWETWTSPIIRIDRP
jgi:minor extracellular serine protease Vpr